MSLVSRNLIIKCPVQTPFAAAMRRPDLTFSNWWRGIRDLAAAEELITVSPI
jgi:hypothetical protein